MPKRGDKRQMPIPTTSVHEDPSRFVEMEYLGCGRFWEAWRHKRRVYLFQPYDTGCAVMDHSKEAIALYARATKHLPAITRHADLYIDGREGLFQAASMPYYEPLTAKCVEAWGDFRMLQLAHERAWKRTDFRVRGCGWGNDFNKALIDECWKMVENGSLRNSLAVAVNRLADAVACYGSEYLIEIAKRNMGVYPSGGLVLRDVAFPIHLG